MTTLGNDVRSGRPGEVGGEHRSSGNGCYVAARWSALGQVSASLLRPGFLTSLSNRFSTLHHSVGLFSVGFVLVGLTRCSALTTYALRQGSDDCIVAKMSSNGVFLPVWGATERLEVGKSGVREGRLSG